MDTKPDNTDKEKKSQKDVNIQEQKFKPYNFFKKVWFSITKIEQYPIMATEGVGRAFNYLIKLVLIMCIVVGVIFVYQTSQIINEFIQYMENDFPDFEFRNGNLDVKSDNPIIIEENEFFGKIIIDTKTQDETQINKYVQDINKMRKWSISIKR